MIKSCRMRGFRTPGILMAVMACAASVAMVSPAQASFDDQFRCDPVGDGEHLVIQSARDPNKVSVQFTPMSENAINATPVTTQLKVVYNFPEHIGGRWDGGEYMFLITNSAAILLYGIGTMQELHTECNFVVGEPEGTDGKAADGAQKTSTVQDVPAKSWGGKLRSGPGMNFKQIDSLRERDPVILLQKTDIMMNGYPWFRLRTADGKEGFQWGGILCAHKIPVEGVFETCD